jgi:hypothetical protein
MDGAESAHGGPRGGSRPSLTFTHALGDRMSETLRQDPDTSPCPRCGRAGPQRELHFASGRPRRQQICDVAAGDHQDHHDAPG